MRLMTRKVPVTLLALFFSALTFAAEQPKTGPGMGQTAPDFSITDLEGKKHSLSQLRKKGHVLLVFWSTRCHYCTLMIPEFKAIHKEYQKKGLTLAAINVGFEDKDEVDTYVFEHKIKYLVLNHDDTKGDIAASYRLVGTPTIQLIAPDGTVKYRGHRIPKLDSLIQVARNKAAN